MHSLTLSSHTVIMCWEILRYNKFRYAVNTTEYISQMLILKLSTKTSKL